MQFPRIVRRRVERQGLSGHFATDSANPEHRAAASESCASEAVSTCPAYTIIVIPVAHYTPITSSLLYGHL